MIALRALVAALVLSAAPFNSGAQDVGAVPGDWSEYGRSLVAANRHREAIAAFERAMEDRTERRDECAWSIARSYALLGNRKQALRWVERAIDLGFADREGIRRAPEFVKYKNDPRLDQLLRPLNVSNMRVASS